MSDNNGEEVKEEEVKRLMDKMLSLIGNYVSTSLERVKNKYKPLFDDFRNGFGIEAPLLDLDDDGVLFIEASYAELDEVTPSILTSFLNEMGIQPNGYPLISTIGLVCLNVEYGGTQVASSKETAIYAVEGTKPIAIEGGTLHCARRALVEVGGGVKESTHNETSRFIESTRSAIINGRNQYSTYIKSYIDTFGFPPMEIAIGKDSVDINTPVPAKLVPDLEDLAIAKIMGSNDFTVDEVDLGIHCTKKAVDSDYILNADEGMLLLGSKISDECIKYVMLRSNGKIDASNEGEEKIN
ncbi:MAG: hypothetical protein RXO22_07200 [Thermocladium sp.]